MRKLNIMAASVAALAIAGLGGTAVASASVTRYRPHAVYVPAPVRVTFTMTDHGDSGGGGNWALLGSSPLDHRGQFTRTLTVRSLGGHDYSATVADEFTFATIPYQLAPNQGLPRTGQVEPARTILGTGSGTATYSFTASKAPSAAFVTRRVIPGTPVAGKDTTSLFYQQVFPAGTVFGGAGITDFAYGYATDTRCLTITRHGFSLTGQSWADTQANGDGQEDGDGQIAAFPPDCLPIFG